MSQAAEEYEWMQNWLDKQEIVIRRLVAQLGKDPIGHRVDKWFEKKK